MTLRVAEWIEQLGVRSVVDVGSGAGKFCVAAALATGARFTGVEHRAHLVAASRELARVFCVEDRVSFVHATFGVELIPAAEAYYFFNPFGENLFSRDDWLDADVEIGKARFMTDVDACQRMLRAAPVGTYVITYNGFGGRVPQRFICVRVDLELPNVLRIWRKVA